MERKIKVANIIALIITGGADENTLFTMEGLDKNKYEVDLITGEELNESILNKVKNNHFEKISYELRVKKIEKRDSSLKIDRRLVCLYFFIF